MKDEQATDPGRSATEIGLPVTAAAVKQMQTVWARHIPC
jgi:hypothetical protein